jgi:hypothetical protein
MSSDIYPLSKLTHEFGNHVIDADSGLEVFDVFTSHSLVQAAGYVKYNLAKDRKGVFFRGQHRLYKKLSPTLFRDSKDGPANVSRQKLLADLLASIESSGAALRSVDLDCREPLLQHYGIRTTWLDVVDNIWIALWFACHRALSTRCPEEYLHFEKRIHSPPIEQDGKPIQMSSIYQGYAYVLLLASAHSTPVDGKPGRFIDERSETIDLRTAVPSHFVRPHAQHGLLVRRLSKKGLPPSDYLPLHVGTIRVRLSAALDWLGNATTLTTHSLFPPAFYDYGYRELLLSGIKPSSDLLGSIHRIQA